MIVNELRSIKVIALRAQGESVESKDAALKEIEVIVDSLLAHTRDGAYQKEDGK